MPPNNQRIKENQDLRAVGSLRSWKPVFSEDIDSGDTGKKQANEQSLANAVKSYELKDICYAEEYNPMMPDSADSTNRNPEFSPVQKMILTEFQPEFEHFWAEGLDALTGGKLGEMLGNLPIVKQIKDTAFKKIGQLVAKSSKAKYLQNNNSEVYSPHSIPIKFVRELMSGQFLNSWELPFFSDLYLQADYTDNWAQGGAKTYVGENISKIMKENMSMDFPTAPIFTLGDNKGKPNIEYEFYLINKSTSWLVKNFRFLNGFIGGAFWIQLDYVQGPTNLYDVLVPGRFHTYFASMGVTVTQVGKLRTNSQAVKDIGLRGVPEGTLFPDAYKISLKVVDLTPNNFNLYVDYLMNGALRITTAPIESQSKQVENYVTGFVKQGFDDIKSKLPGGGG